MTLLFAAGFGECATGDHSSFTPGADPLLLWESFENTVRISAYTSDTSGVRKAVEAPSGEISLTTPVFGPISETSGKIVIGCRIYRDDATECIIGYLGTSAFGITSGGKLSWTKTDSTYDIDAGELSDSSIPTGQWSYCEWEVELRTASTGSINFYINGAADGGASSIATARATPTWNISFFHDTALSSVQADWKITDIYIDDDEVHGQVEVWYQAADTAGSVSNMTPSAGNNEDNVDDDGADGDSTYNSSSTPGTKDQIAHSQAVEYSGAICVRPVAMARSDGVGTAGVQVGVLSDGVESLSGDAGLVSESYQPVRGDFLTTDPSTAAAWTKTNLDAAETVVKHTSVY